MAVAAAAAAAAAAASSSASTNGANSHSPPISSKHKNHNQQALVNSEMIKELKKRNPALNGGHGPRLRQQSNKKEINIEDLIEEINRGYVTADAERRKRQRTQEIKKEFVKTSPIQII